ncbi:CaiB/BaiF CoA transferase family protein [Rhodococcus wratislaviensis]|uniref:CaiB/BaiF CoA transferase family protein n=1 Tax=Rhodococcus wratislaviensis TaxID=44752 RepID=UPI00351637E6
MRRALDGVVVLDLTTALAGPYATMLLAGLGARVIKVENRSTGGDAARNNSPYLTGDGLSLRRTCENDMSLSHLSRSRNKESLTLDLKSSRGHEIFLDLVGKADVVVENFSAGVTGRLGISYEDLEPANPRLIYTSISGFGADGGDGRAMDTIIQALSGIMLTAGDPDGQPIRCGLPIADLAAPLFAVIGTLGAIAHRTRTGEGQQVDVSMLGALTSLVAAEHYEASVKLGMPTRTGQFVPRLAPFGTFECHDGWIAVCAPLDKFAHGVLAAIGSPELVRDQRFAYRDARVENADVLHKLIAEWARTQATAEAVATLDSHGVPVAPVRDPVQAMRDERVRARGEVMPLSGTDDPDGEKLLGPGLPFVLSKSATSLEQRAPYLGEHSRTILAELLGYTEQHLDILEQDAVL